MNLAEQPGQGGAEFMRGVTRESLLPVVGLMDPEERLVLSVQEIIESPAKLLQLVASAWCGQSVTQVGRGHRAGSPGHAIQRRQGAHKAIGPRTPPPPRLRPRATPGSGRAGPGSLPPAPRQAHHQDQRGVLHLIPGLVIRVPATATK